MTEPLSPAAQAVLDAFTEDNCLHDWKHNHYNIDALAAALRAAADQVVLPHIEEPDQFEMGLSQGQELSRAKILAIAAELEGGND